MSNDRPEIIAATKIDGSLTRPFPSTGATTVSEIAGSRLSEQLSHINALDAKIATLFSAGQTVIGIAAAFLALADPPPVAVFLLIVAAAVWIDLCVYSIAGYTLRDWHVGPKLSEAWENAREFDEKTLNWWAAESFTNCYSHNTTSVANKVFYARWAMIFLGGETLFIIAALSLTAAS